MADTKAINVPESKYAKIDKARNTIVAMSSIAVFIVIFVGISGKSLITKLAYQNRIINAKQQALNQIKSDITASGQLVNSYKTFIAPSQNYLGQNCTNADPSCNDAKVVLDALPSQYDYPALVTSIYNVLKNDGVTIMGINGTDQQLTQSSKLASTSTPQPMPLEFIAQGNINTVLNVISDFQRSIRPFQFESIKLSGSDSLLTVDANVQTYYQPGISFVITQRQVK